MCDLILLDKNNDVNKVKVVKKTYYLNVQDTKKFNKQFLVYLNITSNTKWERCDICYINNWTNKNYITKFAYEFLIYCKTNYIKHK